MLATEFFYRGFFLFPFEKFGKFSILPQLIPYVLVHLGKPTLEIYASIPAGIAFGYMAYKTKSVLPSFLAHWIIAVIFDILVMI
jgi:membrane protease YdiL (CAAX protease family)